MRRVREVIVVEGRYDKNALKQAVEATVVETGGFGVFKDGEKLALLRRLAEERLFHSFHACMLHCFPAFCSFDFNHGSPPVFAVPHSNIRPPQSLFPV